MSGAAAQGADGSAAANGQPTVVDDGFTPEERAQFETMQRGDDGQVEGGGDGNAGGQAGGDGGGAAGAGQAGAADAAGAAGGKVIAEEDEDDEPGDQNAQSQQGQAANGDKPQPRRVNFKKFERMEQRAIASEKERDSLKEMFTRADERMKLINEALTGDNQARQQQAENQDPEPDKEKDVFGWMNWAGRQMQNMQKMVTEQRQQTEVSGEERRTADTYVADVQRFVGADPNGKNFGPAYNFLMTQRYAELALYHFSKDIMDEATGAIDLTKLSAQELAKVKADTAAEERELVTGALARRESPAAAVFRMARTRGFRAAPPAQNGAAGGQQAAQGANNGAGGGNAPGGLANGAQGGSGGQQQGGQNGANGGKPNVADEIRRVRDGQAASVSLSNGAGSPGQQALTPERLANMSQDEFNAMMEDMGDGAFRRLMGG